METRQPMGDDFDFDDINTEEEKTSTKTKASTSTSLQGGDVKATWNEIGTLYELNEKIDGMRSLRQYTKSESLKNNDGGFNKQDDVLFFSKIDNQYIPGVIKEKKKDKFKDYIYKIQKIHKKDPEVSAELDGKKRSNKEDPRVEIIKMRQQRAKKQATITWNVNKTNEAYFKIMSVNDYQIHLQIALLKLLKSKVAAVIKKRTKASVLSRQATKIGKDMIKSQQKRDKKQRVAQTFSGSRQQMLTMASSQKSKKAISPRQPKSFNSRSDKRASKHGKHAMSAEAPGSSQAEAVTVEST